MENALNSHLCCAPFTTTGNKSKQSFDALTVKEGGRREMEKDGKMEKTFFCSALSKTQSMLVSTLRWFREWRRMRGRQ